GGYIGLGAGMYTRYWQLTRTVITGGIWCDPWTGWCYPSTFPGQLIADSDRLTKIGYSAVAALTFPTSSGGQLYLQASYHYMNTDPSPTCVPILLGCRWWLVGRVGRGGSASGAAGHFLRSGRRC